MASEKMIEDIATVKSIVEFYGRPHRPAPLGWKPDPVQHALYAEHERRLEDLLRRCHAEGRRFPDRMAREALDAERRRFYDAREALKGNVAEAGSHPNMGHNLGQGGE